MELTFLIWPPPRPLLDNWEGRRPRWRSPPSKKPSLSSNSVELRPVESWTTVELKIILVNNKKKTLDKYLKHRTYRSEELKLEKLRRLATLKYKNKPSRIFFMGDKEEKGPIPRGVLKNKLEMKTMSRIINLQRKTRISRLGRGCHFNSFLNGSGTSITTETTIQAISAQGITTIRNINARKNKKILLHLFWKNENHKTYVCTEAVDIRRGDWKPERQVPPGALPDTWWRLQKK